MKIKKLSSRRAHELKRGFTLIELLVVIAIIAILSVVVILTLNPAELLRQARDSNRISDLGTLKSAISLYLADVPSPVVSSSCSISMASSGVNGTCSGRYLTSSTNAAGGGIFTVGGTGWVPINLNDVSSGAPIGNLPRDPSNSAASAASSTQLYYSYKGSSTALTFSLVAKMESSKYVASGTADVESTDGGKLREFFESGTNITGL